MPTNVTVDQKQTSVSVDDFETSVSVDADANITAVVSVDKTYGIIQEDGSDLAARPTLNFGTGLAASDDSGNNRTNVNIEDNTSTQKVAVEKNDSLVGTRSTINFIEGTNVTITVADDSINDEIDITINSNEAAYNTVQEDGTPLTQRDIINFDATLLAADDAINTRTNVGVVDDTSIQQVEVGKAGSLVATRKRINFEDGAGITVTVADDSGNNETDVTVAVNNNTTTQKSIVSDNGTQTSTRQELNFIDGTNIAITVADDSGNDRANITINGPTLQYQIFWYIDGTLTTGDMQGIVHKVDRAATITDVSLTTKNAPSGGIVDIDIETATSMAGPWTTIFSTKPQIADGQQEGGGSASFSDTALADGDLIRLNIDTATSPADNLSVHLNMTY